MSIRVTNIRLPVDAPEAALAERLEKAVGQGSLRSTTWRILRKSLDTRDKRRLEFIYSIELNAAEDDSRFVARIAAQEPAWSAERFAEPGFEIPPQGARRLTRRPLVVGSGPAGLMAAFSLAQEGYAPIVLERGRAVRERIQDVKAFDEGGPLDPESNYLFGEGGAGAFSDGKLTCRVAGPDVRRVLEVFAELAHKPSLLYEHRPHLGSNRLPAIVKALRRRIEANGGEFRFSCRMESLDIVDGQARGVGTSSGHFPVEVVVLAIGHSARDTYRVLHEQGVPMEQKPFQLGLRIEQPQEQVNRAQYGSTHWENLLGAADYRLISRGDTNVFTFCMCAGGQVIPSVSEPGYFCTNGMSLSRRGSPFANSGLMVTIDPSDFGGKHVLAGVALQREYESRAFGLSRDEYRVPIQRAMDFLRGRPSTGRFESSYPRGVVGANLSQLIPPKVVAALEAALPNLDRRWRGEFLRNATLVGPESRGSAPVRFPRHAETLESTGVAGLYPVGEGAGYAGGIVSAALDGLRAAKAIIRAYAPWS